MPGDGVSSEPGTTERDDDDGQEQLKSSKSNSVAQCDFHVTEICGVVWELVGGHGSSVTPSLPSGRQVCGKTAREWDGCWHTNDDVT